MKILVCISKTPETTAKIAFSNNNSEFDTNGVQFIMNPYDEWYALVRAIELKEATDGSVDVIHVGDSTSDVVIRKALAIGADAAYRVDAIPRDSAFVGHQIADHARFNDYDIIFLGKETIDYNGSELGGIIAEHLDLPFLSYVSKMDVNGSTATVERDIEGGVEQVQVDTPFVLSAMKGLAEQRIPNMRGIMMAKKKPLHVIPAKEMNSYSEITSYSLPPEKKGVQMIDPENMDELVRLLHEESKVI